MCFEHFFYTSQILTKHRGRSFLSSKIPYTRNYSRTFQLTRFILGGEFQSNPGPTNVSKSISCFLQNVRSLKGVCCDGNSYETKLKILQDLTYGYDFDVVCLTKTWLNESICDFEILPYGYEIFRNDRLNRTGDGVMIVIK